MEQEGCAVCDAENAPLSVSRIKSLISSYSVKGEMSSVDSYLFLLKEGVLSGLHSSVRDMMNAGSSLFEARSFVDDALKEFFVAEPVKVDAVEVDSYQDDWDFSSSEDELDDESVDDDDGWSSVSVDGDYSDDWFGA